MSLCQSSDGDFGEKAVPGNRKCTRCQCLRTWDEFHKKGERFASRCKKCIRREKRDYRKRIKRGKNTNVEAGSKFRCSVRGEMTPAVIENISKALAELIRIAGV